MDDRASDGVHSVGHLHQRAEAGRSGEAPATARLIRIRTNEKPELLANQLDQEEHRNFATEAVADDRYLFVSLHVQAVLLPGDKLVHRGRRLEDVSIDLPAKRETLWMST